METTVYFSGQAPPQKRYEVKWEQDQKGVKIIDRQERYSLDIVLLDLPIEFCHVTFSN